MNAMLDVMPLMTSSILMPEWLERLFFREQAASHVGYLSDLTFMAIFWVSVAYFVPMMVLMFYFTVKYRRRPGVAPLRSPSHNTRLELLWSVIPSAMLVPMFLVGFWLYMDLMVAPGGAEEVNLTAQKWSWRMTYDNGGESPETTSDLVAEPVPIFRIPMGEPIVLKMTSVDVLHSWWMPAMRRKRDVFPNRYTTSWIEVPSLEELQSDPELKVLDDGTPYRDYWVFCAEYCGDSHSEMGAIVRAVPPEAYRAWKKSIAIPEDPVEWGSLLHKTRCASCHSTDGTSGIGPTWQGLWGTMETLSDGSTVLVDENYVRESIYNPSARITQGYKNQMSSFEGSLDENELNAIIAFMKSLAEGEGE